MKICPQVLSDYEIKNQKNIPSTQNLIELNYLNLEMIISLLLVSYCVQAYDPPQQCFYCVKDNEEECVRTQASLKWDEQGCGFVVKNNQIKKNYKIILI